MKFIKPSFSLKLSGAIASEMFIATFFVLCCALGVLIPTQCVDAKQISSPNPIQPIPIESGLPQETLSTPKYDFAPPITGNRRPTPTRLENNLGSGMTHVNPRESSGGQLGNFVTPLDDQTGSGFHSIIQPENLRSIDNEKKLTETGGRVEVIRERYPDGKVQIMRQVTQDKDRNYYNHGAWQLFNRLGEVMGQGEYYLGRMEGQWKRWHPSNGAGLFSTSPFNEFQGPYLSIAEFSNGKLNGVWTIADRGKNPIFEASYQEGVRHGTATWYHTNGSKLRECTFRNGLLDGPFFEWNKESKTTLQEEYIKGRRIVSDIQYAGKRQKLSESFYLAPTLELDGEDNWWEAKPANFVTSGERIQHGPTGTWYPNGQPKMQGQFDNGERVGVFVGWHANGQKDVAGQFEAGKKVGAWTWWHPNGIKRIEGQYEDETPVGEWTWWDADGSVRNRKDMSDVAIPDPVEAEEPDDSNTAPEDDQPEEIQPEEIQAEEVPSQELPPMSSGGNDVPETIDIPEDVIPYKSRRPTLEPSEDPFNEIGEAVDLDSDELIEGTLRSNSNVDEDSNLLSEPDDEIEMPEQLGPPTPIEDPFGDNGIRQS